MKLLWYETQENKEFAVSSTTIPVEFLFKKAAMT